MRIATITPVFNEEVLIAQYLKYYANQIDTVFLLDNESTDNTVAVARKYANVEVTSFSTAGELNHRIRHDTIMGIRNRHAGRFDYMLLVDVDEFVYPTAGGLIRDTLGRLLSSDVHGTEGYNMFPGPDESAYDPSVSLLDQRKWGYFAGGEGYSKPIIIKPGSNVQLIYGMHIATAAGAVVSTGSPEFYLLHYRGFDEDVYVRRTLSSYKRRSQESRERGFGGHYKGDEDTIRNEFRENRARVKKLLP